MLVVHVVPAAGPPLLVKAFVQLLDDDREGSEIAEAGLQAWLQDLYGGQGASDGTCNTQHTYIYIYMYV